MWWDRIIVFDSSRKGLIPSELPLGPRCLQAQLIRPDRSDGSALRGRAGWLHLKILKEIKESQNELYSGSLWREARRGRNVLPLLSSS